jgi:hypothetical protein
MVTMTVMVRMELIATRRKSEVTATFTSVSSTDTGGFDWRHPDFSIGWLH